MVKDSETFWSRFFITGEEKNKRPTQRVGLLLENYEKRIYEKTHTCILNVREKSTSEKCFFLVGDGGFGPPKSVTTDLQSAPFGRSGNPPKKWSW